MFLPLPNDYSVACLKILEEIGLTKRLVIDDDENIIHFENTLPYFHPQCHVLPTIPTNDKNISLFEGYIFSVTQSM